MELRDFAEQILFATTLEEKLRRPKIITDERPGSAFKAPLAPGRPSGLAFKSSTVGKADFPGLHRLEDPVERGRLLHFFANHELLATELMALVLLRFPDAPTAFRRGVWQTLCEEQMHTRLYLERMKQCGVHFGDLPVSGYFWRAVSAMTNPMDYVCALSLTFEQANLDFCRHFARGFETVGDLETARLLEKIYRDEIGHVAYGLKWFRRWKNPAESDWDAFCRHLKFPLTPQRAKGINLNIEGRRAAGLAPEFIDALNVYSHSKGRTPHVFVFNPLAEGRLAQGKSFTPSRHHALLARDLENLPQFLCRQDDVVLVRKKPSVEFLSEIKRAGFAVPEFVELTDGRIEPGNPLVQRKLGGLRPWAWAPDSLKLLEPLLGNVTGESPIGSTRFNEKIAALYSKAWSAEFLQKILSDTAPQSWLCAGDEVGLAATTTADVMALVTKIRQRGHHKIVVKEALGLAGANSIRLWEPEILPAQQRWIEKATATGHALVVEPWLERALDFSIQLEMTETGLKLCGYTGLINDLKGQFQGNWAAPNYLRHLPRRVGTLLSASSDRTRQVEEFYGRIFSQLARELRGVELRGPVGIDALIYRTAQGDCRLKPIVEINPRYTMGRLTVELMKRTCPGSYGLLRLINGATARAAGDLDFAGYAERLRERFPIRLEGEPVAKIREGAICLNDPTEAKVCLATFQVSATPLQVTGGGARLPTSRGRE
jgi:uncharacterized ferritin-like protein (DUF455 family)